MAQAAQSCKPSLSSLTFPQRLEAASCCILYLLQLLDSAI